MEKSIVVISLWEILAVLRFSFDISGRAFLPVVEFLFIMYIPFFWLSILYSGYDLFFSSPNLSLAMSILLLNPFIFNLSYCIDREFGLLSESEFQFYSFLQFLVIWLTFISLKSSNTFRTWLFLKVSVCSFHYLESLWICFYCLLFLLGFDHMVFCPWCCVIFDWVSDSIVLYEKL